MKNILKYSWILGFGIFVSCSNWLNVEPFDQVSEERQYSKAEGFYNQLNGIYKTMAKKELYGKELTWGLLDVFAQYYDMGNYSHCGNNAYTNGADLEYEDSFVKPYIVNFWETMYNVIANCNNLIQNTMIADTMLFPLREKERRCIEGEARALRAMLHFDLLRMYAPAPQVDSTGKYIAYVDYFPTHVPLDIPTNQVLEKIQDDLLEAHSLTADFDTLYKSYISNVRTRLELSRAGDVDRFMQFRGYRLNHYAIKALLARVALYRGDNNTALQWATDVLKYYKWFSFDNEFQIKRNHNMKLYSDVMFALYNNNTAIYESEENTGNSYMVAWDYNILFDTDADRDFRRWQWKEDDGEYFPQKYKKQDDGSCADVSNIMIPMIRFSEMCYILAECYYETDTEKAEQWLNYIRQNRGCRSSLPSTTTQKDFNNLILKDFRREFYGEGQLFFFYKRLGLNAIGSASTNVEYGSKFTFPIPESNDI